MLTTKRARWGSGGGGGWIAASRVHFIWLDESRTILCGHILYEVWYQWRKNIYLKLGAYFAPVDLFWKDCGSFFHQELSGAKMHSPSAFLTLTLHILNMVNICLCGCEYTRMLLCMLQTNKIQYYNNVNCGKSLKFFGHVRGNIIQDYIFFPQPHILKGFAMPP